jgi:hypothetical protein
MFRSPDIEILPPLAAGRTKPFPQRPHHKRRQLVRQVLDAAPPGLTDRQLIELIREQTGVGCSFRTICEWRKERRSERENERQRETPTTQTVVASLRLTVIALLFCVVSLAASSCRPPQAVAAQSPLVNAPLAHSQSDGIVITQPSEANNSKETPRLLQLKLTINAASDLLVKTDDEVKAGQALTNRSHERNRLLAQRRVLETQAQQIEAQLTTAAESLALLEQRGADLPPISFASEQAAITKAEAEAAIITRKVELQKQKLSVVSSLLSAGSEKPTENRPPATDHRQLITEHETARLTFAQDAARQAAAEVALQKAKLTSAQEARAFAEKQHALELSKQLLTARHQQQQAVIARSQLLTQIAALDLQLAQLAEVRAPFAGKIRRIEYEDMHDQTLTVLVYLAVHQ